MNYNQFKDKITKRIYDTSLKHMHPEFHNGVAFAVAFLKSILEGKEIEL